MANVTINPAATKVEYTTAFDIEQLEALGWDFSEYYHNRAESMAEKAKYASYEDAVMGREVKDAKSAEDFLEEATKAVRSEHLAFVRLRTEKEGLQAATYYALFNHESNETYAWEPSGDDAKTLEDVVELLNADENYTYRTHDESQDVDGDFVHTFIEIA